MTIATAPLSARAVAELCRGRFGWYMFGALYAV